MVGSDSIMMCISVCALLRLCSVSLLTLLLFIPGEERGRFERAHSKQD